MAFIEKGEFTLESTFETDPVNQTLNIRMPHRWSGKSPLVFRVQLFGTGVTQNESNFTRHNVLIQRGDAGLLVAHQLSHEHESLMRHTPVPQEADYLYASYFDLVESSSADRYQLRLVSTGYLLDALVATIKVDENRHYNEPHPDHPNFLRENWVEEVRDEGDLRIFSVSCSHGSNKIAIPKDLRPFVGRLGKPIEKDLAYFVDFETYTL